MALGASSLAVVASGIVAPVLQLIRDDLHLTTTAAGLVVGSNGAVVALASPAIGRAIDRCGAWRVLGIGLLAYGIAGGIGGLATSLTTLLASRLLLGVGVAAVFSGTTVALLGYGADSDRVAGWRTAVMTASGLVWPVVAGLLGGFGWRTSFVIYLIAVPLGAAILIRPIPIVDQSSSTGSARGLLRHNRMVVPWLLLIAVTNSLAFTLLIFMPQRLSELGVHAPVAVSLFMTLFSVAASTAGIAYPKVRRVAGPVLLLRVGTVCWTVALVILGAGHQLVAVFVAAVIAGVGSGLGFTVLTLTITRMTPPNSLGRITALSTTAIFVGQFTGSLSLGQIADRVSIAAVFFISAAISLAAFLMVLLLVPDLEHGGETDRSINPCNSRYLEIRTLTGCFDRQERTLAPNRHTPSMHRCSHR